MNKFVRLVLITVIATGLNSVQSNAEGSVVIDRVIAVVNNEIITMSDLERASAKLKEKTLDQREVLEELINKKLQLAAAKQAGMDITEKELDSTIADIRKSNAMDAAAFEVALAKEGLTTDQYKEELKEQLTLTRVFNKYVRSGLAVSDAELRTYYKRNIDTFSLPEEIQVRHIFIKLPNSAGRSRIRRAKQQAHAAYSRARKGEDFILLVREFSDEQTAASDGDLGFLRREDTLPEIAKAAQSLKPGDIAGPLKTDAGYHIIRLEDVRTPIQPFEQAKEEISRIILRQKMETTYREWLQALRNKSHIEIKL